MPFRLPTTATAPFCPSEVRGSVAVADGLSGWRKALRFVGPGLMIAVGYIDPGNWATDIEGGSRFGYDLLFVIGLCSLSAILLQWLAMRLGIVTDRDLAQMARDEYRPAVTRTLWLLAEIAIIATDVAEVLGSALAFNLLFGLPLWLGVLLTALDTILVLGLKGQGFREVEAIIGGLLATIAVCFMIQLVIAAPSSSAIMAGLVPDIGRLHDPHALYLAVGILGATVMPHNLYLHSSIVQTRLAVRPFDKREALRFSAWDSAGALLLAGCLNGGLLILAAATFHANGFREVAEIEDAYRLLEPITGASLAALLFGIALLASGQSATFTGTIAGQVILEGFLDLRIPCWLRRVITRGLALIPALAGVLILGDGAVGKLLVLTQVILALQLPFALYPLIRFTSSRSIMGQFTARLPFVILAWIIFGLIVSANLWLISRWVA